MTTAGHATRLNEGNAVAAIERVQRLLQFVAGFFFAFRICIVYLGFQSNPSLGTEFTIGLTGCLFVVALLYALGDKEFSAVRLLRSNTLRWLAAYLAVSGASLLWTQSESTVVATVYWAGMAIEVATVLLLAKGRGLTQQVDAMMKGFVVGTCGVAAIAWLSPTLPDLRIGHDEFLVPNLIGLYCALAFFLAQYLALEDRVWKWFCFALALALLRTISKTSIIAFLIAESLYLMREKQISRAAKIKITAGAGAVVAMFWSLFSAYLAIYAPESSNSPETLTGRTLIWAMAFPMALEHPWIGHGFYSFRSLIPAVGTFQAWHAHNEFLQQFFEFGLLGVILAAGLYLALLSSVRRNPAHRCRELVRVLVIFCAIHGLADTASFGLSLPMWLFTALAMAATQPAPDPLEATAS